jgi:hypothetical protein
MDKILIYKNYIYFLICIIFIILYFNNSNNKYFKDNNNNEKLFDELNYKLTDNKYIIDRSYDNEFSYNLQKIKSKIKSSYKNIILITSKIIVSFSIFSYISVRSIYTIEQRFNQTKNTIKSIRKNIPDVCIFLIDNSNFENGYIYIHQELKSLCDVFINPLHDNDLNYYTNINKYKSIAEGYQIMYFLDIFNNLNLNFDRFFKISGRYYLNDTFNYDNYITEKIIFSRDRKLNFIYYYTCFYMIPKSKFNLYINSYKIFYNNKDNEKLVEQNIEYILPMLIKLENIKLVDNLGITQMIAVRNEISDI